MIIVAALFLDFVPHDRAGFQVAHAGAVRLRDHGVPRPSGLGRGTARHVCPATSTGRSEYLSVLVAILGTTISPYLFFWQAAQEVEEERAEGKNTVAQRQGATDEELRRARTDVLTGMFFSNFVMYFIILTTAATLHAHGITNIATAQPGGGGLAAARGEAAPTGCSRSD